MCVFPSVPTPNVPFKGDQKETASITALWGVPFTLLSAQNHHRPFESILLGLVV